ncbi:hypothetical protein BDQ12DRAFT_678698 [Crucibulum laeve]|uniref:ER membrane protein complex subunit 7 beta-sandwich domain-containing protein n=1 Tax=Crucibulum laeve TaxID=68775 RepID=A0A5C3M810_9AGAR|nr:hypothetical protein BDQ12DRAFT_678698 [Crucibulum laeve]
MTRITLIFGIFSCALMAFAVDIAGKVTWNDICPDSRTLHHANVLLDDGKLRGSITRNGTFIIPDVPVGTYVFSVSSHDFVFDNLRIDVRDAEPIPEVRPYVPGTPLDPPSNVLLSYPINVTPRQKHDYFIAPESFNILKMLSNPMMLIMVFGGGMVLAMPYLIKNMDPESLEEFKEQQAKMAGLQNAVRTGDLKSGFTALLSNTGDEQAALPPAAKAVTGGKSRGKKARR